jgi:hypothetical protein
LENFAFLTQYCFVGFEIAFLTPRAAGFKRPARKIRGKEKTVYAEKLPVERHTLVQRKMSLKHGVDSNAR